MTVPIRVGQVYAEKGYPRHFKVRSIEGSRAIVSACLEDGGEFRDDGPRTRIRLDRLIRSPYRLIKDSNVKTCPECDGSGVVVI